MARSERLSPPTVRNRVEILGRLSRISDHLETADVVLLLVSADFLASDYCYQTELTRALERHRAGSARVVPIVLRLCDWQSAAFGELQALPRDARPVAAWDEEDAPYERKREPLSRSNRGCGTCGSPPCAALVENALYSNSLTGLARAASWIDFKVRPSASFHSMRPFALRPSNALAAIEGDLNR